MADQGPGESGTVCAEDRRDCDAVESGGAADESVIGRNE